MIQIDNVETYGWEAAIRGMRNPMNSWNQSDTKYCDYEYDNSGFSKAIKCDVPNIGENDFNLMKRLSNAGTDHSKFLRMITVSCDITSPLYWWKEFDTYKVGTVANSCSTMHKIHSKEFTLGNFSHEHLLDDYFEYEGDIYLSSIDNLKTQIKVLNFWRERFLETKNKDYWWQMIQLLPSSYNQKRTVMLNYAVLRNIYHSRKNHKLDEWVQFCKWIETLPYSELITEK